MDTNLKKQLKQYRITSGKGFAMAKFDPTDTGGIDIQKADSKELLQRGIGLMTELQDKLYAQNRWSVLLIFQAMDAAGKDSAIKHVMSGVNPQGVQVYAFKRLSDEELDHDFMWRCTRCLPERGRIGVFNRSYYEEVLVARVHEDVLKSQRLPKKLFTKHIFDDRLEDIAAFERYLARQGTLILKFYLNVSKKEQKKRFLARLDEPEKNWKFEPADVAERQHWDEYMDAYERAIRATAAPDAPWYVVPADNKWYTRLIVAAAVVGALQGIDLHYPPIDPVKRAHFDEARAMLMKE